MALVVLFHTSIFQNECTFLREILSIIDIDFVWRAIHPLYLWCGQLLNKAVLREQIMARLRNMCEPASTGDPTRSCRDSISDKEMIYANQTQPTVTRSWGDVRPQSNINLHQFNCVYYPAQSELHLPSNPQTQQRARETRNTQLLLATRDYDEQATFIRPQPQQKIRFTKTKPRKATSSIRRRWGLGR